MQSFETYNLPGDWAREQFKPSADSSSLVVKIEKKTFLVFGGGFRGGTTQVGVFMATLSGPGPQPIGPLIWLNIFAETRPKSASLKPLNDFLAYL